MAHVTPLSAVPSSFSERPVSDQAVGVGYANNLGHGIGRLIRGVFDRVYNAWGGVQASKGASLDQKKWTIYKNGLKECALHMDRALSNLCTNPRDPSALGEVEKLAQHYARYLKPAQKAHLSRSQQKILGPLKDRMSGLTDSRIQSSLHRLFPVFFQNVENIVKRSQPSKSVEISSVDFPGYLTLFNRTSASIYPTKDGGARVVAYLDIALEQGAGIVVFNLDKNGVITGPTNGWKFLIDLFNFYIRKGYLTSDGDLILTGYIIAEPNPFWVIKIDSKGNAVWSTLFDPGGGVGSSLFISQAVPMSNGTTLAVGTWIAEAFDPVSSECVLSQIDSNGRIISTQSYSIQGSGIEGCKHLAITSKGEALVLGFTQPNETSSTLVYKLNANGEIAWAQVLGIGAMSTPSAGGAIFESKDGNVIVVVNHLYPDNRLSKYCGVSKLRMSDGSLMWAKRISGTSSSHTITTAYEETDGSIILIGSTENYMLVAKLDSTGVLQWARNVGGVNEQASDGAPSSDGGIFIAGSSNIFDNSGLVVKLDSNGTVSDACNFTRTIELVSQSFSFPITSNFTLTSKILDLNTEDPILNSEAAPVKQSILCSPVPPIPTSTSPTPINPTSPPSGISNNDLKWIITGSIVGGVALAAMTGISVGFYCRRQRQREAYNAIN